MCGKSAPHQRCEEDAAVPRALPKCCEEDAAVEILKTPPRKPTTKRGGIGSTGSVSLAMAASETNPAIPGAPTGALPTMQGALPTMQEALPTMQRALQQILFVLGRLFNRKLALEIIIVASKFERKCKVPQTFYDTSLQAICPTHPQRRYTRSRC